MRYTCSHTAIFGLLLFEILGCQTPAVGPLASHADSVVGRTDLKCQDYPFDLPGSAKRPFVFCQGLRGDTTVGLVKDGNSRVFEVFQSWRTVAPERAIASAALSAPPTDCPPSDDRAVIRELIWQADSFHTEIEVQSRTSFPDARDGDLVSVFKRLGIGQCHEGG
jgi:hypothetical protein